MSDIIQNNIPELRQQRKEEPMTNLDLPKTHEGSPVHWIPEWEKHMGKGAEEAHLDGTSVFIDPSNEKPIALAKGSHIDHYGIGEAKAVALAILAACEYETQA